MDNQFHFNLTPEGDTATVLIGKANTPKQPKQLTICGNFQTVRRFAEKRLTSTVTDELQEIAPGFSVVICNEQSMTITLFTDPTDVDGTVVQAKAQFSAEHEAFGINQNKMFTREQLIKLIRFSRRYFVNAGENAELLARYQKFTAKVNKDIVHESDQRGNRNIGLNKTVTTDLPDSFVLNIPIFKGEQPVSFPVEICIEENDSGVRFWFESVELEELIYNKKQEMFERELHVFKDVEIPIIYE